VTFDVELAELYDDKRVDPVGPADLQRLPGRHDDRAPPHVRRAAAAKEGDDRVIVQRAVPRRVLSLSYGVVVRR